MSNNFNLWLLNNKDLDRHPRSWICINGKEIDKIIADIEYKIIKKNKTNREQISHKLAKTLNCNHSLIKNILRGTNTFYPLPIVVELCNLIGKFNYYRTLIEKNIEYFKVNSASAKPIKASKKVSKTLSKILGAFCADGSLSMQFVISSNNKEKFKEINISKVRYSVSRKEYYVPIQINKNNYNKIINFSKKNKEFKIQTHYTIELTDEYESNVNAFEKWLFEEFKIKPYASYKRGNAYRIIFSNKILARYLIEFFEMFPGYKCTTVNEPKIIKYSPFYIRKEFAKGALMFDGCITKKRTIMFSTLSPYFSDSIKEILAADNIKVGNFKNNREEYTVYTTSDNKIEKLLGYFEEGTKKWELLMWLSNRNFTSNQINYEKDLKETNNILKIINQVKVCDSSMLMKKLNFSHTTIRQHLLILKLKGVILLSNHPKGVNMYVSDSTMVLLREKFHNLLFNEILKKFKSYKKFSKFLEVNESRLSAWKLKKNRIPLKILKEICLSLEMPYNDALNNVYETDREIAEVI